jgi:AhpD family alkylhydroperoxidase
MVSAQETFDQIEQELGAGMIPRIFRLLEGYPVLLGHLWGQFRTIVLQGSLPRILKEMVGLVVASTTHCEYVKAVHLHSLTLQGVDQASLDAVKNGDYGAEVISTPVRKALQFAGLATAIRSNYGDPTQWPLLRHQTAQALEDADLEEGEQLELVATVALFEQICTVANLFQLDPNQP